MNFSRGFVVVGATLTVLAGVLGLFPGPARRLGLDFWDLPDVTRQLQQAEADRADLDLELGQSLRRVAAKDRMVRDVLEGRLTLWQAAARFRTLELDAPAVTRRTLACRFPVPTEEERCCREVIDWVAAAEEVQPDRAHGVARRLAAELDDALRRGPLSLPAPAPAADADGEGTWPPPP